MCGGGVSVRYVSEQVLAGQGHQHMEAAPFVFDSNGLCNVKNSVYCIVTQALSVTVCDC